MNGGSEALEVIACGFRPEGSLVHLAVMGIFVLLAWRLSPESVRVQRLPRAGS
jgi:hypothetical protein